MISDESTAEPWWINSLVRNPVILPYTLGLKRIDMMYLDTTFASREINHQIFPTKREGLEELLQKVMMYPNDTVFHFHAWVSNSQRHKANSRDH